jgi:hypothetical protein
MVKEGGLAPLWADGYIRPPLLQPGTCLSREET